MGKHSKQLTVMELCAGYNGLGMAVESVFGARPLAFSEFAAAPSKILAHRYPGVPNYGDMTTIDWASLEPADIISGGTPCQDLSSAGRRAGMTEGTRSNLWVNMREAIAIHQPTYVVWENVRGAFSAKATSSLEFCAGCMGEPGAEAGPVLRALGRVLGDLADLGYDCQWRGLRAAEVGACHPRFRVFVLAALRNPDRQDVEGIRAGRLEVPRLADRPRQHRSAGAPADSEDLGHQRDRQARRRRLGPADDGFPFADPNGRGLEDGQEQHGGEVRAWQGPLGDNPDGRAAADAEGDGWDQGRTEPARLQGGPDAPLPGGGADAVNWDKFGPAIRRWERITGRPAPRPTEPTGRDGAERLSPVFTEWMMGLPEGWVTDPTIGLTRNEQLKACGDGVVPQQAHAALADMLHAFSR